MSRKSLVVLIAMLLLSTAALTAQVRTTKPNDVTISLGGSCLVYSFGYQRAIGPSFALNTEISYIGGGTSEGHAGVFFVNGGARYFFLKKPSSPYISGGIGWISAGTGAGPADTSGSTIYEFISPGFEFRSEGGFVFRGGIYFMFIKDVFFVWPGISLGIAF